MVLTNSFLVGSDPVVIDIPRVPTFMYITNICPMEENPTGLSVSFTTATLFSILFEMIAIIGRSVTLYNLIPTTLNGTNINIQIIVAPTDKKLNNATDIFMLDS